MSYDEVVKEMDEFDRKLKDFKKINQFVLKQEALVVATKLMTMANSELSNTNLAVAKHYKALAKSALEFYHRN